MRFSAPEQKIAISTRGHLPARFFSPPKVIFPAQGAARGFAQQTQGRSRGLEKLPRAVKKTKGSAQGLNVAFHTWCLENVVFVGVDIPKILLAAGQREEIDEQLPFKGRREVVHRFPVYHTDCNHHFSTNIFHHNCKNKKICRLFPPF